MWWVLYGVGKMTHKNCVSGLSDRSATFPAKTISIAGVGIDKLPKEYFSGRNESST